MVSGTVVHLSGPTELKREIETYRYGEHWIKKLKNYCIRKVDEQNKTDINQI